MEDLKLVFAKLSVVECLNGAFAKESFWEFNEKSKRKLQQWFSKLQSKRERDRDRETKRIFSKISIFSPIDYSWARQMKKIERNKKFVSFVILSTHTI